MANFPTEYSMFATGRAGTEFFLDITDDQTHIIPVPIRSLFRRIIIHMAVPPDAPAVLTLFKNTLATAETVTVPTTIPPNSGIELSWPNPVLYLSGEAAYIRTDGNPTATANAHATFIFDRDLRTNTPRSTLPTEFAIYANIFATGIHVDGDKCEEIPVPEKSFLKRAVLRLPVTGPNATTTLFVFKNGVTTAESIKVLEDDSGGHEYAFPNPVLCQKGDLVTLVTLGESSNAVNPRVTLVFDRSGVP